MRALTGLVLLGALARGATAAVPSTELRTIDNPPFPDPDLQRVFGRQTVNIIATADRVDALRINPEQMQVDTGAPPTAPQMGLRTIAARRRLPKDLAARVQKTILTPRMYRFGGGKGCGGFRPGVLFRFSVAASKPVDVYLCFTCNDLAILRSARDLRVGDVTAGRLDLLKIATEALPDDPDLRHLYQDEKGRAENRLTGR